MKKYDRKKVLIAILVVILVLSGALYYIHTGEKENEKGITAMEGAKIANKNAEIWNSRASLVYVTGMGEIYSYGKCDKWRYTYSDNNPDLNLSKGFEVIVFENGSSIEREIDHPPATHEIDSWKIDSTKALEIAKSSDNIRTYLEKHDDAYIESVVLTANESGCAWSISWMSWGFWDDPQSAVINIDATTGEVLYVEATPGSSLSTDEVCMIFYIVITLIFTAMLSVSYILGKRAVEKEKSRMRIEMERKSAEEAVREWDRRHGR